MQVILDALVGALNNRPKLPDTMVFMFGDTTFWCEESALNFTMDSLIQVFLREVKRIIEQRQADLPVKAVSARDPWIIFVKLNWKPDKAIDSVPEYPRKRRLFNKLLDAVARPRGVNTILLHEINDKVDPDFFLSHGELSQKGYRQVWNSLSNAIRDFHQIGHQKKKVYTVMAKNTTANKEVDSSLYSSDDELFADKRGVPGLDANRFLDTKIQNKRRHSKFSKGYRKQNNTKWAKPPATDTKYFF